MTLLNLTAPPKGFVENPFELYSRLLKEAPLDWQPDGSVLVSRYADLDMIYRDTKRFISDKKQVFGPKFGETPLFEHHTTSLVFNDPPLHTRVRRIMTAALAPKAIARMEPGLIAVIDDLLDKMPATADLIEDLPMSIPIQIN